MGNRFSYIAARIDEADFVHRPFKHLYVEELLEADDFAELTTAPEIAIDRVHSDPELFRALRSQGYEPIHFPGCIEDEDKYIEWHLNKGGIGDLNNTTCESFGVTLRLENPRTPIVKELCAYIVSDEFNDCLAAKIGVRRDQTRPDGGLQKYLDGYEISPHPDMREKALTFMVNLNPHPDSERHDHHTHYSAFKPEYKYVQEFWAGNPGRDRCWVPWGWCETVSQQRRNNSMVAFSPANDTIHGVKASYDHLVGQRTQLYGNLWYNEAGLTGDMPGWEELEIGSPSKRKPAKRRRTRRLASKMPPIVKAIARAVVKRVR